ncbi:MAG TPA: hypothetical protein VKD91_12250 [Pyrinomonadaceae bacterium]|nr:hypothetical protein [Pyrinomonadaceae bacterium]
MKRLILAISIMLMASAVVAISAAGNPSVGTSTLAQGAETFTHQDAGVQFQLPTGWKAKPDGEVITVSSADDALQVVFWVPDEDTFDAAVKELDKELGKTIKDLKTDGKPVKDTHNGMAHYEEAGTGVVNGATIAWSVDVLGAKKPLIILTFAAPNLFEKNAEAYGKLVASIKKIG